MILYYRTSQPIKESSYRCFTGTVLLYTRWSWLVPREEIKLKKIRRAIGDCVKAVARG